MLIGPVFAREAALTPRREKHYILRTVYVAALLVLICTAWLVLGTNQVRGVGDMARFGANLFRVLAVVQLPVMLFFSALTAASAVAQEKDRRTLILLMLTRLNNSELVLGKLAASLIPVVTMLVAGLPVFLAITLLGGVSTSQVIRVFLVTLVTALAAGSLGSLVALWREKTFQTLAIVALGVLLWMGFWETLGAGVLGSRIGGVNVGRVADAMSPLRAVLAAARPRLSAEEAWWMGSISFVISGSVIAVILNLIAILKVRVWNPSREVRLGANTQAAEESIWGAEHDLSGESGESARQRHVDARVRTASTDSREVWDNPVLWRETRTKAYGRKLLLIRLSYLLVFALCTAGLAYLINTGAIERGGDEIIGATPAAAYPLAPFFLVSLVIINALAVTSITNERDGQSLDLLLVTDLTSKEFVFGKLLGVMWVTKEVWLLPILLCGVLWQQEGVTTTELVLLVLGWLIMAGFATMLGAHCGMAYANSRSAIGVSLGTVFFLFLGVAACMIIMLSFSNSFESQLAPFLFFLIVGTVGLYVSLGARNPSPAIFWASMGLPFATFNSLTSFLLGQPFMAFIWMGMTYGFAIAAMLVPAIGEFDIAMGRTKAAGDD